MNIYTCYLIYSLGVTNILNKLNIYIDIYRYTYECLNISKYISYL